MNPDDLQFFNKKQDCSVFEKRNLPHWIQAGTLCFITWRVADSLPQQVLVELDFQIEGYLRAEGIERRDTLTQCLLKRDEVARSRIHWKMFLIRDKFLDRGAEGRTGEFWQVDQFDHLIRGELQFEYFRRYIWENPEKAGLRDGEYLHWQKELGAIS